MLLARSRHLALLALLAATSACGGGGDDGPSGPTTGTLSGRVVAGTESVSGATITLSGGASRSTTTSASGSFAFADLAPGAYTLSLGLPTGFTLATGQNATRQATVVAGQTATVDWSAQRVGGGGGGGGTVVEVHVTSSFTFSPATVQVPPGTTVKWIWDASGHSVTPDNPNQAGAWNDTGLLNSGATFQHTFNVAGEEYAYHCTPHQSMGMTGTVRVSAAP